MTRNSLVEELRTYSTTFDEERKFIPAFLELLKQTRCFHRDHLPGHITGSAWIVNKSRTRVLLVHHAKLNRWLQPGGHADGEENVLNVATREAEEETGLSGFVILQKGIFDIDVHTIPARKDFPEHLHYDIRFLLEADDAGEIIVSEESHDVKWIDLHQLPEFNSENSISRLKRKLELL